MAFPPSGHKDSMRAWKFRPPSGRTRFAPQSKRYWCGALMSEVGKFRSNDFVPAIVRRMTHAFRVEKVFSKHRSSDAELSRKPWRRKFHVWWRCFHAASGEGPAQLCHAALA
jgi:hypothetical protein